MASPTFGTSQWLQLEICAFRRVIYKKIQAKSSMRVDPFSIRVTPTYRMVLKASSKVVLTASELLKVRISVHKMALTGFLSKYVRIGEGEDLGHQSLVLDYVPGQPVNLEKLLPPLWFCIQSESGELICKAWGLHLEGVILVYDPIKDEPDCIPIKGCMNDLSWVEAASAKELSELVLWPWEWEMHGAPQDGRGKEEDMEGSPTDETDKGPDGWESPTDSGDSLATSSVSTSKEEWEADRQEVESENSSKEEITKEPMEEEDTESVGCAMMDTTLGSISPSSQEAGWLEAPLDLSHPAGGNGGAEPASVKCELQRRLGMPPLQCMRSKGKASQNPLPLCCPP